MPKKKKWGKGNSVVYPGFCHSTLCATHQHPDKKKGMVQGYQRRLPRILLHNNIQIKRRKGVRVTAPFTQDSATQQHPDKNMEWG